MIVLATKNTKNTKSLGLAPDPQKKHFVNFVDFVAKNQTREF